jgi:hypothetical protein
MRYIAAFGADEGGARAKVRASHIPRSCAGGTRRRRIAHMDALEHNHSMSSPAGLSVAER